MASDAKRPIVVHEWVRLQEELRPVEYPWAKLLESFSDDSIVSNLMDRVHDVAVDRDAALARAEKAEAELAIANRDRHFIVKRADDADLAAARWRDQWQAACASRDRLAAECRAWRLDAFNQKNDPDDPVACADSHLAVRRARAAVDAAGDLEGKP